MCRESQSARTGERTKYSLRRIPAPNPANFRGAAPKAAALDCILFESSFPDHRDEITSIATVRCASSLPEFSVNAATDPTANSPATNNRATVRFMFFLQCLNLGGRIPPRPLDDASRAHACAFISLQPGPHKRKALLQSGEMIRHTCRCMSGAIGANYPKKTKKKTS